MYHANVTVILRFMLDRLKLNPSKNTPDSLTRFRTSLCLLTIFIISLFWPLNNFWCYFNIATAYLDLKHCPALSHLFF